MKQNIWLMPTLLVALTACQDTENTFMVGTLEQIGRAHV